MRFPFPCQLRAVVRPLAALALVGLASACSPSLNWRKVQVDNAPLTLLLPCKPDRAERPVPLGGRNTTLSMVGCEAEGATFALAVADIGDAAQAGPVLAQWQQLTLAHMRSTSAPSQAPAVLRGADAQPAPVRIRALGQQADGRPVESQALYFARGSQLFQAVIYAPRISAEMADTFFEGLALP